MKKVYSALTKIFHLMPEVDLSDEVLEQEIKLDNIDYSDLEAKYTVKEDFGLDNYILVDGAPIIPEDKVPVLTKVLKKLLSSFGDLEDGNNGFCMPIEAGMTKGYLFAQYKQVDLARKAIRQLNGKPLDKKHRLLVNGLSDVEKYAIQDNIPSEFVAPEIVPPSDHGYLKSWLQDEQGRDQLLLHYSETVGIYWNKKQNEPEAAIEPRKGFTSKYAKFSPKGTYLCSIHPQGIQSWGGRNFESLAKFVHNQVRLIDFSPNENYLVTLSPLPIVLPESLHEREAFPFKEENVGHKLVVWDLKNCEVARTFALPPHLEGQKEMPWPLVKWSFDDKYCARQGPNAIAIYETPSFQLLNKKLVEVDSIVNFEWAPTGVHLADSKSQAGEHILSYWTPESANQTARVALMQVPSTRVIRTINLFQVGDCKMHWHDESKYLCVKVDRHSKSGKTVFSNLEFFKTTERDIPVEKLELKEVVINFAWEPNSDRFITISRLDDGNNNPSIPKNIISFYSQQVSTKDKVVSSKYKAYHKIENKFSNTILWAPKGRFAVVATISKTNGEIDFFDCSFEDSTKKGDNAKLLRTEKYSGMTNLAWDPSGRFIAGWSSSWIHHVENGYKLFEFTGNMLRDETIDQFKEFIWRPRPPSLLTSSDKKRVRKNMRQYSAEFDESDAMEADAATREAILLRRKLLEEWRSYRSQFSNHTLQKKEEEAEIIEEIKEEIIEEREEVIE